MSEQHHYSDQDAEEILRIAAREAAAGGMSRERLLQTASELGISPETVERAEEQMRLKREADRVQEEDRELRKQFQAEQRSKFMTDFWSYIGINAGLIGIWALTGSNYFWPAWVLVCWGMGVVVDFFMTFLNSDETKFQRWKRRRHRKSMSSSQMGAQSAPLLDELVSAGKIGKIEAIKTLRERLSMDMRDAKDVADQYERDHPGVFT